MSQGFYLPAGNEDANLRFGDVLHGLVQCTPSIDNPKPDGNVEFKINVSTSNYFAVISPCCSIGPSIILLAPLLQLTSKFFNNPHFVKDFTKINSLIPVEESIAPDKWINLPTEEKTEKLQQREVFVHVEYFIYDDHPLLPKYKLTVRKEEKVLGTYVIDFRHTFQLHCEQIQPSKHSPLDFKILQLSIDTRQTLRDKITKFYSRVPKEDIIA